MKPFSEEYLAKESSEKFIGKDLALELETLQKENRDLKIAKQMKSLNLKSLNGSHRNLVGEKFFKLITSLLAEKIKN